MSAGKKQSARRIPIAPLLLIAFIGVPLLEIAIFIQVGGIIGLGWTLALVVLTALIGTWMLRQQGFQVLRRAQRQIDSGVAPVTEVFEGACLLVAGALLLTPGFFTDAVGALLLLPPVRAVLFREVRDRVEARVADRPGPSPGRGDRPVVIDAEFEEVDVTEPDAKPPDARPQDTRRDDAEPRNGTPMPPPRGGWGSSE